MSVNTTYPIGMGHTPRWEGIVLKILNNRLLKLEVWLLLQSSLKITNKIHSQFLQKKNQRVEVHTKSFSSHHETPF